MYGFPVIRSIAFVVAASVIAASCSGSPEALPTSTEQVVSTTAAATTTTTTETPSETTEELVERLGGAVVRLDVAACDGEYVGAGFLIDEHHIVTVAHNIVGAELIAATTGDEIAIAEPVGVDVLRDIALLRTDIPMGDVYFDLEGTEPVVGQDLVLFGFPLGLDLTVTRGIVSNADVELPEEPLLRFVQIDAAANPGNSGGPVVTAEGDLIGILQSGFTGFEGLNFATKLSVVERLLESWVNADSISQESCTESVDDSGSTSGSTSVSPSRTAPVATAVTTTSVSSAPDNAPVITRFGLTWALEGLEVGTDSSNSPPFGPPWHRYSLWITDEDDIDAGSAFLQIGDVTCPVGDRNTQGEGSWGMWFNCQSWPSGGGSRQVALIFTDGRGTSYNLVVGTTNYPS